jgi:protoheme ferro-lyase
MRRHVVLVTYGEPPTPAFLAQLRYSWRILLGLTRAVAPIPVALLPVIALSRARLRNRLWSAEGYRSPLEPITLAQAEGLRAALARHAGEVGWRVHTAYEFRDPLLATVLDRLPAGEPADIVPMYVADSAFTHEIARATVARRARRSANGRPAVVRVLPPLDEETFADLSAAHVAREAAARGAGGPDWALVLAAHGTLLDPPRPIETGRAATERIAAAIGDRLATRFGSVQPGWLNHVYGGRWTEPPVDVALKRLAEAGFRRVVYFPFGFSADNAESQLEGRIALRGESRLEAIHLPCLNASPEFLAAIARQIARAAHINAPAPSSSPPAPSPAQESGARPPRSMSSTS